MDFERADSQSAGGLLARDQTLGPFLAEHWRLPIAPQGSPPPGFSDAEASLEPETCGSCHPQQFAQWRDSVHGHAYSPGFAGQLIEGALATPSAVRDCQRCHAPLGEQQPFDGAMQRNAVYSPSLRPRGVVCASCHRRAHGTFGPARRPEASAPPGPLAHDGFTPRGEFTQSRFCAGCHQFFDTAGVNGKPIENTWAEWAASPMAAAGRTCQSCHMPDRAHTWRGIHDPGMVRAGVAVALVPQESAADRVRASLVVLNRDVGHAFPTYVTPRVFLESWQEAEDGTELAGTRERAEIGRQVDFDRQPWREVFDTRILPGESVALAYDRPRTPEAVALVGRVTVDPDYHYRGVYAQLLTRYADAEARRLIAEAARLAADSRYVLVEHRIQLAAQP